MASAKTPYRVWQGPNPRLMDHSCAVEGCSAFGPYGFALAAKDDQGRPLAGVGLKWFCRDHRDQGRAYSANNEAAGDRSAIAEKVERPSFPIARSSGPDLKQGRLV